MKEEYEKRIRIAQKKMFANGEKYELDLGVWILNENWKVILQHEGTRCWKGYEKGMKTLFGKRVQLRKKRTCRLLCKLWRSCFSRRDEFTRRSKKWFKQKWVLLVPDGKVPDLCGGKSEGEGKPYVYPPKGIRYGQEEKKTSAPNEEKIPMQKDVVRLRT